MSIAKRKGQETKVEGKGMEKMVSEQSLTDTDQQKATEKPNQRWQRGNQKGKQQQKRECTTNSTLCYCQLFTTWLTIH